MYHLKSLHNGDNDIARAGDGSFYTAPPAEDTLSAEIFVASRLHEAVLTKARSIITTTESASLFSEMTRPDIDAWASAKRAARSSLPEASFLFSPTQSSLPRDISVRQLILGLGASDIPFSRRLVQRLEELVEVSQEEFPEQEPMSSRSLQDFIEFIRSVPDIAYPDVVLSYEGNVCAEWTQSHNKHCALEFLGGKEVRFVVFAPDPKKPYKTNRVSGISTLDSLLGNIHPYGVLDWITTRNKDAA